MARYKPQDHNSLLLPVVLSEQILPGSFAFALDYLVDHELDLSALDARFNNDEVGASAYDPRVMLKIVLLAYSQGLISSRTIEQACARNAPNNATLDSRNRYAVLFRIQTARKAETRAKRIRQFADMLSQHGKIHPQRTT
jgi:hypothetical protein